MNIAIVEPSSSGYELISSAIRLGIDPIILSLNKGDRLIPKKYLKKAKIVEVDTTDELEVMDALNKRIGAKNISAIIPGFEYYVPMAAKLSSLFGLPGLDLRAVENVRYKDSMRDNLANAGIDSPRYIKIKSKEDLNKVENIVGFPCVIKPIDSSGSICVKKIYNVNELRNAYLSIQKNKSLDMGFVSDSSTVLVEEYIDGLEYSLEGFVSDQGVQFISVTEKLLVGEPYFTEIGHVVNTNQDKDSHDLMRRYTEKVLQSFKVNMGPFHCELRIKDNKCYLMEVAARLPGDNLVELINDSTGINMAEVMIKLYLGEDLELSPLLENKYAGICFYTLQGKETYSSVIGLHDLISMEGFKRVELMYEPDSQVPPPTSSMGRVAKAIFTASDYSFLKDQLQKAFHSVHFS